MTDGDAEIATGDRSTIGHKDGSSFRVRTLPVIEPPTPVDGGRIITPSGELVQVLNDREIRLVVYLEFTDPSSGMVRGNHYRLNKTEFLYVISGRIGVHLFDTLSGDEYRGRLAQGDLVEMRPGCAHAYWIEEVGGAIELATTAYDASDTHQWVLR